MVDIHCHILPGIDDGSKSWETTEAMCQIAAEDGITHIVCSPHANDEYKYDRSKNEELASQLRERMGNTMRFSLGCDFHFSFENIQAALANPAKFIIQGTDYLLVEFSDYAISPGTEDALLRFRAMGITPIITHPERNALLRQRPDAIAEWVEAGARVQVTAQSLLGDFGRRACDFCKLLLDRRLVHFVASDAHDWQRRPPLLDRACHWVAEEYGDALAEALFVTNPRAVLSGIPLDPSALEVAPPSRKWYQIWRRSS